MQDFMSFRKMLKGSGVQVVFSSILPVGDWDQRRKAQQMGFGCMAGAMLRVLGSMILDAL